MLFILLCLLSTISYGISTEWVAPIAKLSILHPKPTENVRGLTTLYLMCVVSGNPVPKFSFFFNGQEFVNGSHFGGNVNLTIRHEITDNILKVHNVRGRTDNDSSYYDTGYYKCSATNIVGTGFDERYVKIRVGGVFLRKTNDPKTLIATMGESFTLKCPKHTKGYGTIVRWGFYDRVRERLFEIWFTGLPPRVIIDNDGNLVFSVLIADDMRYLDERGGIRCVLFASWGFVVSHPFRLYGYSTTQKNSPPVEVISMPKNMKALEGSRQEMTCVAKGSPPPKTSWFYKGESTSNFPFIELTENNMTLIIKQTSWKSVGKYTCVMANMLGNVTVSGSLFLYFRPKWLHTLPVTYEVSSGQSMKVNCNASGRPAPIIKWYHNGKTLSSRKDEITHSNSSHNGVYTCTAENKYGYLIQQTHVIVKDEPPKFTLSPATIYLVIKATMFVHCLPKGSREMRIDWLDLPKNDARFSVLTNGSLQISNIKKADERNYRCRATNKFGSDTGRFRVIVADGVEILGHSGKHVQATLLSNITLFCNVKPSSILQTSVRWFKDNTDISSIRGNVKLEKRVSGHPSLLFIRNFQLENSGLYYCKFTSRSGNHEWTQVAAMNVSAKTDSSSAGSIQSNVSVDFLFYGNALMIRWGNDNTTYEHYILVLSESKGGNKNKINVHRQEYLLKDLKPFTYYTLSLYGVKEKQQYLLYSRSNVVVSKADVPAIPKAPVIKAVGYNTLHVSFLLPNYGGIPEQINVYYKPTGNKTVQTVSVSQDFIENTTVIIKELDFLPYDIWVRAMNSLGTSEASAAVTSQPIRKPVIKKKIIIPKNDDSSYDRQSKYFTILWIVMGCAVLAMILWFISLIVHKRIRKKLILLEEKQIELQEQSNVYCISENI